MNWQTMLAHKTFWIFYLRLFQDFTGDRVATCCDFFGVTRVELETIILLDLYQLDQADEEDIALHILRLPTTTGAMLEIAFHPYGPGEKFTLAQGADAVLLAEADVDDVCVPRFPLRNLPAVAARLSGDLAQTYGALLLYKLTHVTPEDDLDALADLLRAAFPPDLFTPEELDHILAAQQRAWCNRLRRPRPVPVIAHPLWQVWISLQSKE
ncbi:MAG: hypothetical protein JW892_01205 [Anaerolineae bacterium]|nr:hypothetical protein [Anaerolineae bacterium]